MTIFYTSMIMSNLINLNFQFILTLFDLTISLNLAYTHLFCEFFLVVYFFLTLIEITWLKYLYKFIWKSMRSIDDCFVVACCCINNVVFSTLLAVAWIMSGGGKAFLVSILRSFEWHITFWINEHVIFRTYFRYQKILICLIF